MAKAVIKYSKFKYGLITDAPDHIVDNISFSQLENFLLSGGKYKLISSATETNLAGSRVEEFRDISLFTPSGIDKFYLTVDYNAGPTDYYLEKYDSLWNPLGLGTKNSRAGDLTPNSQELNKHKRMINLGHSLRIEFEPIFKAANSFYRKNYWYGYIKRNRFNNAESFDGYYLTAAELQTPVLIGDIIDSVTPVSSTDYDVDTGVYFIFVTFEHDGNQESHFYTILNNDASYGQDRAIYKYTYTGVPDAYFDIKLAVTSANIDRRITAINVYMGWNSNTKAKIPNSGYYHIARIDMNDQHWTYNSGTGKYEIDILVAKADALSTTFPTGYYANVGIGSPDPFDEPLEIYQEFYTKNYAIGVNQAWTVSNYKHGVYYNGRMFISHPSLELYSNSDVMDNHDLPYDPKQVVLYSVINQPDKFFTKVSYIDVSTNEGDEVTGLHILNNNLIVVKEKNIFVIQFNNSGNEFDWDIVDFIQSVGSPFPKAQIVINNTLFFLRTDGLWIFDGRETKNISKDLFASNISFPIDNTSKSHLYYQLFYDEIDNLLLINGGYTYGIYALNLDNFSLSKIKHNTTAGQAFVFGKIDTDDLLTYEYDPTNGYIYKLKDTTSLPSRILFETNDIFVDGNTDTFKFFYTIEIVSSANLTTTPTIAVDDTVVQASEMDVSTDGKLIKLAKIGRKISISTSPTAIPCEISAIIIHYRPLKVRD